MLFGFLGVVIAILTAVSGFGSTRYQTKEDWKGTTGDLAGIQEANRVIIFAPPAGEYLVNYCSKGSLTCGFPKIGVPANFLRQFPPTKGMVMVLPISRSCGARSNPKTATEVERGPHSLHRPARLILDYLDRNFIPKDEQEFYGDIKVFRYIPPPSLSQLEDAKAR